MLSALSENDGVVTPMSPGGSPTPEVLWDGLAPQALGSSILAHKNWEHWASWGSLVTFKVFLPFLQRIMHVQSWIVVIFHPVEFLKSNSLPSFRPIFSVYISPSWQCFCHILHPFYSNTLVHNTKLCISLLRLPYQNVTDQVVLKNTYFWSRCQQVGFWWVVPSWLAEGHLLTGYIFT